MICIGVDCGSLTSPVNGRIVISSTTFESTASYLCNSGYNLVGVNSRTCQSNGQWSGVAPTCITVQIPTSSPSSPTTMPSTPCVSPPGMFSHSIVYSDDVNGV